jgi:hypothetical protein
MNIRVIILVFMPLVQGSASQAVTECVADATGKSDSTQAFTSCLASTPAGDVYVPAGQYKILGSITKNRSQNLIGAGSKASVFICESTAAPCIVIADTEGPNLYADSRIQDLALQGPGTNNSSIGIFFGGDPSGHSSPVGAYADSASLTNVRISGFNRGVEFGNNSWANKFVRTLIFANSTGIYVPTGLANSGENLGLTDSLIFNNSVFGLDDHGRSEWMVSGSSFDYNGTAIEFFGATIHAVNSHFEQSGGHLMIQPYGYASLSIKDSEIIIQANTGSDPYILSTWPQWLNIAIDNVSIWSNHPIQYFMRSQGTIVGTISGLYGNGNKMITSLSDKQTQAVIASTSAF